MLEIGARSALIQSKAARFLEGIETDDDENQTWVEVGLYWRKGWDSVSC
jgi:hypothetical protein